MGRYSLRPVGKSVRFLTPLRVEKIGPQRWLLIDDLSFESALLPGVFRAPRGFQTDFASIPRVLWAILPPADRYDAAAVIHDGAYAHVLTTPNGDRIHLTKQWGDALFYEALRACGVNTVQTWMMWKAVDVFGNPMEHPLRDQ